MSGRRTPRRPLPQLPPEEEEFYLCMDGGPPKIPAPPPPISQPSEGRRQHCGGHDDSSLRVPTPEPVVTEDEEFYHNLPDYKQEIDAGAVGYDEVYETSPDNPPSDNPCLDTSSGLRQSVKLDLTNRLQMMLNLKCSTQPVVPDTVTRDSNHSSRSADSGISSIGPADELEEYYSNVPLDSIVTPGMPISRPPTVIEESELEEPEPRPAERGSKASFRQPSVHKSPSVTAAPTPAGDHGQAPWYFGDVSREQATELVKSVGTNGCFLVRDSVRQGQVYTLSVFNLDKVYRLPVRKREDGLLAIGKKKDKETAFKSLTELVSYYRQNDIMLMGTNNESVTVKLQITPLK